MKIIRLLFERKSQVLIAVLIAFTIMLTLGAAIIMHSRSTRTSAKLETDAQKAYVLAQSGINIGSSQINGFHQIYNIGGGTVDVKVEGTTLTATSDYQGSAQTLTKELGSIPPQATTWVRSYGGSGDDYCYYVNQTAGGYILGGQAASIKGGFGSGGTDILLVATDEDGKVGPAYPGTWANAYGGAGDETMSVGNSVFTCPKNGGYIVTVYSKSISKNYDILLVKVKADGTLDWARGFSGGGARRS